MFHCQIHEILLSFLPQGMRVGAQTRRSLGHNLLHLHILRLLVLLKPADFEAQSSLLLIKQTAPADPNS
jgi:hypothetical protein